MNKTSYQDFIAKYFRFSEILFFVFLICVFALAKVFSKMYLSIGPLTVYTTEIYLFLSVGLLFVRFKDMLDLPKAFLIVFMLFFLYGDAHMVYGLTHGFHLSVRDIVLCGYLLFFPLTYIICQKRENLKLFLKVVVLGSIVNATWARCQIGASCYISDEFLAEWLGFTFGKVSIFNLGLYYGMAVVVLLVFIHMMDKKSDKVATYIFLSIYFYLIIIFGTRSLWLGIAILLGYIFLFYRGRLIMTLLIMIPFFALITSLLVYLDFKDFNYEHKQVLMSKLDVFQNNFKYYTPLFFGRITASDEKEIEELLLRHHVESDIQFEQLLKESDEEMRRKLVHYQIIKRGVGQDQLGEKQALRYISEEKDSLQNKTKKIKQLYSDEVKSSEGFDRRIHDSQWWRLRIWELGLRKGMESPIWGRGFGRFLQSHEVWVWNTNKKLEQMFYNEIKDGDFIPSDNAVITPLHNQFITLFYKEGIIGVIMFLFLNIYSMVSALRHLMITRDLFIKNFLIVVVGWMIYWNFIAFFFDVIDLPTTSIFIWIFMGLIFAAVKIDKQHQLPEGILTEEN